MSSMRSAAKALVEHRTESFESRHDEATSRERLARALERARVTPDRTFDTEWLEQGGRPVLKARFHPARRTLRVLQMLSLGMAVLIGLSVWAVRREGDGAERFLLPLCAVLLTLALPLVTLGLASAREARESRIRRAIRAALQDEDER